MDRLVKLYNELDERLELMHDRSIDLSDTEYEDCVSEITRDTMSIMRGMEMAVETLGYSFIRGVDGHFGIVCVG